MAIPPEKVWKKKSAEIAKKLCNNNAGNGDKINIEGFTQQLQKELATVAEASKH